LAKPSEATQVATAPNAVDCRLEESAMTDDLDRSFDAYDQRKRDAEKAALRSSAKIEEQWDRFEHVRDRVIRPVLEVFKRRLEARQHSAEIKTSGSRHEDRRIASGYEPYIELKVFVGGGGAAPGPRSASGPRIRFEGNLDADEVVLNSTFSDGQVSEVPRSSHTFAAINESLVQDEVETWLKALLARS
jgi:hypothetical protein